LRPHPRPPGLVALAVAAALIACGPWLGSPEPTPTDAAQPGGPRYLSAPEPAGYLLYDPAYDTATLFTADGHMLEVYDDLQWLGVGSRFGAAASPLFLDERVTRLAYLRQADSGAALNLRQGSDAHALVSLRDPIGLCGSIPAGYVSVADLIVEEDGSLAGTIYLIDVETGDGASAPVLRVPVLRSSPPPMPLAIAFLDGSPSMLYYTLADDAGDSSRSPQAQGLFTLDLSSGRVSTFLDQANEILGMSPDLTFVAFHAADRTPPEVRLARLDGASTVLFQPTSGAREVSGAVFAPDSSRLAWVTAREGAASGPSFQLSLASTFGGPVTAIDLGPLLPPGELPVTGASPVAWLTVSSILLQVDRGSLSTIYRYQVDTGEIDVSAAGTFVTLFYP
jgi:hypothetical protein